MKTSSPITHLQFGLMAATIPAAFAEQFLASSLRAQTVGWWMPGLFAFGASLLLTWPVSALVARHSEMTMLRMVRLRLSTFAAAVVMGPLAIGFFLSAVIIVRIAEQLIAHFILTNSPTAAVQVIVVLTIGALVATGPTGLGRLSEILILLIAGPLIAYLLIISFQHVNPWLLRPILANPLTHIRVIPLLQMLIAYSPIPLLFVYMPHLRPPRRPSLPLRYVFGALALLLLALSAAVLGVFGPEAGVRLHDPVLSVLDTSNSSILIFQTIGTLVLTLFLPLFFVAASVNLWAFSNVVEQLVGQKPSVWWASGVAVLLFFTVDKSRAFHTTTLLSLWSIGYASSFLWALLGLWWTSLITPGQEPS